MFTPGSVILHGRTVAFRSHRYPRENSLAAGESGMCILPECREATPSPTEPQRGTVPLPLSWCYRNMPTLAEETERIGKGSSRRLRQLKTDSRLHATCAQNFKNSMTAKLQAGIVASQALERSPANVARHIEVNQA